MKKFSIGVLGAGTWGMALARMLTVSGNDVQVWSAIEAEVDNLSATRVHPNLPGMVMVRPAVRMRGSASTSTPTVRLDKSASNIVFSSKLKNAQAGKALAD